MRLLVKLASKIDLTNIKDKHQYLGQKCTQEDLWEGFVTALEISSTKAEQKRKILLKNRFLSSKLY